MSDSGLLFLSIGLMNAALLGLWAVNARRVDSLERKLKELGEIVTQVVALMRSEP